MIPVVTPKFVKHVFPKFIWDKPVNEPKIYLTFDDGPEPEITSRVLALLFQYKAKATFFCLGEKVENNPILFNELKSAGHGIGNHGYKHLSGFSTPVAEYISNYKKGKEITGSSFYRPPYGRITPREFKKLDIIDKVVMWSIMCKDFDTHITPEKCTQNILSNAYPGAIIVMHDSPLAAPNMLKTLPVVLQRLTDQGYVFETIC